MLSLGAISFAVPWALATLAALPVIWWLLRLIPPAPRRVAFPPIRLLLALMSRQESPAKSPWWLLLLRLVLAAIVILAAAHPLLNATTGLRGTGPMVLLIDDGWASARDWPSRQIMIANLLDQAERQNRLVAVVTTAPHPTEGEPVPVPVTLMSPEDARADVRGLQPKPWAGNRRTAAERLAAEPAMTAEGPAHVMWLTDGLDAGEADEVVAALRRLGLVTAFTDAGEQGIIVLRPPVPDGAALKIEVLRVGFRGRLPVEVTARREDGTVLARQEIAFADGERRAELRFSMPTELRNRLDRFQVEGVGTAGALALVDERWRRRPVGLVSAQGNRAEQPLVGDLYYLERALAPFTEIRKAPIGDLLRRELAVMVLSDPGPLPADERALVEQWIVDGGVAVRFAGPRLAQNTDVLLPVALRSGDRVLGGALSWGRPATLAAIDENSPLYGIRAEGDIRIRRQVLAQPSIELAEKTWARLSDGTPLVTADRRGKGWLILVHTTANPEWSDLAMTGVFVDMLRRFVGLSRGVGGDESNRSLPPLRSLDGFGQLGSPPATALPLAANAVDETVPGPRHPPGYYGSDVTRRALNLTATLPDPEPLPELLGGVEVAGYAAARETDLRPWLFLAALILVLVDLLASLWLRRLLPVPGFAVLAIVAPVSIAMLSPSPGHTQASGGADAAIEAFAMNATLTTRLAYVVTGDESVDETSRAGLWGLSVIVKRRTAAELGDPVGVKPAEDDLAFFPLLYWPITDTQPPPTADAVAKLNTFLRNGGTILFDTRDGDGGSLTGVLQDLAADVDIPPLSPIPADHVLSRAYYLLRDYPGRYAGGTLWVERAGERINDGVSSVIVGAHDWAAAWAMDGQQRHLFAVVPGGERQREWAYRVGINLVMYTLTGNYKADQVHLPAIINRLGQ